MQQSGNITISHLAVWLANGVIGDGGTANVSLTGAFTQNWPVCFSSSTVPVFQQCGNPTNFNNATFAAGTALIAPLNFTAGVNLNTAVAGAYEYDGKAFYQTPAALNRGLNVVHHFQQLTASYSLANVNTAQQALNGTTNGAITLPGTTGYRFRLKYLITNTGTVSHTWGVLFGGTAGLSGSMSCVAVSSTSAAVAATQQGYTATLGSSYTVTAASTSATENVTIDCDGIANISTAGTLIPQVQLSTATGAQASMLAGSYFEMWAQGSNTVVSVGNWN